MAAPTAAAPSTAGGEDLSPIARVLDQQMVAQVIDSILRNRPSPATEEQQLQYHEALSIELLRLATLLITHMSEPLSDLRKDLIKFAWNHLKSEDLTSKHCAYVMVSPGGEVDVFFFIGCCYG